MTRSIVETYILALKARKRVSSDDDLAKSIGVGKSTIASWRRRGAIPSDVAGTLLTDQVLDYFLVIREHLALVLSESPLGDAMIFKALLKMGRALDSEGEMAEWATWLAEHKDLVFEAVAKDDSKNYPEEYPSDEHIGIRLMALGGRSARYDLVTPELLHRLRDEYHQI